jgi:AcrR family transcriptional regulator
MGVMSTSVARRAASRSPGGPREFVLDGALDRAIGTFTEHGYHATSLGQLTAAKEIAEGSLYKAFDDNRGVFLVAFEPYVLLRGERLARELIGPCSGHDKIKAMLSVYAGYSLTDEIRAAGHWMTSVYADHEISMQWQRISASKTRPPSISPYFAKTQPRVIDQVERRVRRHAAWELTNFFSTALLTIIPTLM